MSLFFLCSIWLFATLASSQFDDNSGIPACASTCSSTAFNAIGCVPSADTATEWTCVCAPDNGFFYRAVPCFSLNCTTAFFLSTSDWFTEKCAIVNIVPPPFQSVLNAQLPSPPQPPSSPAVNVTVTATLYTTPSPTSLTTSTPSSSTKPSPVADNGKNSSFTSASIACMAVGIVLACSAIIFGGFIWYRRVKRGNSNAGVSGDKPDFPHGEDIDLVASKDFGLRYPNIEGQDFSANLASDDEFLHSPFAPKFTPAIISISGQVNDE